MHRILFGLYAIASYINSLFMIKGVVDFAKSIQMEIQSIFAYTAKQSFYFIMHFIECVWTDTITVKFAKFLHYNAIPPKHMPETYKQTFNAKPKEDNWYSYKIHRVINVNFIRKKIINNNCEIIEKIGLCIFTYYRMLLRDFTERRMKIRVVAQCLCESSFIVSRNVYNNNCEAS